MSENEDLALLLEADTLELIRIQGIFLVFSIALFSFSAMGKIFCIISLLISFAINITMVINYYMERNRITKLGFYPKRITDIIAFIMLIVALFTLWILYEVIQTEPVSLATIAKDIENKLSGNVNSKSEGLGKNLQNFEEKKGRVNVAALASTA